MFQDIIILLGLFAVFVGVWVVNIISRKNRKACIQVLLKEEWGSGHQKEYTYEEFEWISHYYKNRQERGRVKGLVIDDITWNDLEMDDLFLQMNHTYSDLGEAYLYDLLRRPQAEEEMLQERERLITYFSEHEEERRLLQTKFYEIGKVAKVPVSDYIYRLLEVKKRSNVPHYLAIAGLFAAVLLALFNITAGVVAFIAIMGVNINSYYKEKQQIEAYISTFSYVMKLLDISAGFEHINIPEVEKYVQEIVKSNKQFKKFQKGSSLVVSGRHMGASVTESIMDYFRMLFHVDLIKFNSMLEEFQKNLDAVECIMENLGFLDSMIAIASYRESLSYYCVPVLERQKKAFLNSEEMYHPMIEQPVANTIREERGVLVTGSNASGKSTFLKTVAVTALLAQTIHTCAARKYHACYFQMYSSMALKDNLQGQESYYIVEIKSLKRILNHVDEDVPLLCFVDEVLRGTNTIERISASAQILKSLAKRNVMCFAATHDIELTHLLETEYSNYHFQEEVKENDIEFDYILYKGRAVSRNAIKLLGIIGYDEKIIKEAEKTAKHFVDTGIWSL